MALEEKAKLQKHFTRFDIYFFLICTIVGVDTLGVVAAEGAQGFTWLIFLASSFFVPYALLTAELGSAFPEEGGAYVWTRLAWGRLVGGRQRRLLLVQQPDLDRRHARAARRSPPSTSSSSRSATTRGCSTSSASRTSGSRSTRPSSRSGSASGSRRSAPGPGSSCSGLFVVSTIIYAFKNGLSFPAGGEFKPTYALFIALVPGAVLQLRRLRAAERGRRRDEGSAEGRAVHRPARRNHGDPALRPADPRGHRGASEGRDHRRRRLHDGGCGGLHRLRRRRERDDEDRRLRLHPRLGLERLHVADGLRPEPGRGLLRRRRAARARPVLGEARHARERQLPLGRDLDDRLRRGGAGSRTAAPRRPST